MRALSRTEEIILATIIKLEGNAYGVSIRDQIYADTGKKWSFASIYQPLEKLCKKSFLAKQKGAPTAERGGKSKFYYQLTPQGRDVLNASRREYEQIWSGIPAMTMEGRDR